MKPNSVDDKIKIKMICETIFKVFFFVKANNQKLQKTMQELKAE